MSEQIQDSWQVSINMLKLILVIVFYMYFLYQYIIKVGVDNNGMLQ